MLSRESLQDRDKKSCCNRLRASDPQLAGIGVGNELDVSDPLAQLVECRLAARQQGLAIRGRDDSFGSAIQEPHAERMLKAADHL